MQLDRRLFTEAVPPLILFIVLLVVYVFLKRGSIGTFEAKNLLINGLPLVFVALGQYWVVLTREIDLSLGPLVSLVTCLLAMSLVPAWMAIPAGLIAAVALGTVNGGFVTRLAAPSVIVTLGTMTLLQGISLLLLPAPAASVPPWLTGTFAASVGPVPVPLILLAFAAILSMIIGSTRFSVEARSCGIDATAAQLNGIRVGLIRRISFLIAAAFAFLSGIALAAATYSGSPAIGNAYILSSLAAVVVGGVSLRGGSGSPLGVILGCYALTLLGNILYLARVPAYLQTLVEGCVLLAAVSLSIIRLPRRRSPA